MEEKELFKITKDHLDSGLRGYPIGYCVTSKVDPKEGIFYKDICISKLYDKQVEEVMYLLIEGKLPDKKQLVEFKGQLIKESAVSDEVKGVIDCLPTGAHPMKMYAMAILSLGIKEGKNDLRKDFMSLQAKLPEITARVINHGNGWATKESKPELGFAKNFCQMLGCSTIKDEALFCELINMFLVLHMDHGGGNLSMFVAKAVASGHEDLYGSYAAALLALSGPRHGKANEDSLEFVKKVYKDLGDSASSSDVEKYVRDLLDRHDLVYGFGHAVLRCEDPRASILFDFSNKHFSSNGFVKIAALLREEVPRILKENPKIQDPYNNVDSISGVTLAAIGFDFPSYFPVLFGMSRMTGVGRQIIYETLEARDGKGVAIYRPKYLYKELP